MKHCVAWRRSRTTRNHWRQDKFLMLRARKITFYAKSLASMMLRSLALPCTLQFKKKKKDLFFLFVTISCVKKVTNMRFTMVLTACRNRDLTWYRVIKSYWKWSYAWSRSVKMHPHYKTSYTLQSATKYTKQWRSVVISEKVINIQSKVACRIAINRWVCIM